MVHAIAEQYVDKTNRSTFLELAKELVRETLKEDGCISYDVYRDEKDESHLTFIEKWASRKHLEAHFETVHFKRIVPQLSELVSKAGNLAIYNDIK